MKEIEEYTAEELQEIGRKTVIARQKRYEKTADKRNTMKQLWAKYKAGEIKL